MNTHYNILLKYVKTVLLLLMLLLFIKPSLAQKKSIRFQHYTTDQGLPQNMVDCMIQDSKGFMWFGTWNGLCRFDGYSFKIYQQQHKEKSTITNSIIYSICEDFNENLWIGTNDGLNIYIYDKDLFLPLETDSSNLFLKSVRINYIATDLDSTLWVGSANGMHSYKLNGKSEIISVKSYLFGNNINELTGRKINHLMVDHQKKLWVSTDNGLCTKDLNANIFEKIKTSPFNANSIPSNMVFCTFEDSEGLIWIGTDNGVSKLDSQKNSFTNYSHDAFVSSSLIHNSVMSVTEDKLGKIIIGTLGGISIYKKDRSELFVNYTQNPNTEYDLNNNFINCVYTDKWGNVWIGTERGGINKYNASKKEFEYFEKELGSTNTLNNNTINSIFEDNVYIWIGTAGGGLNRYTKSSGKYKYYTSTSGNSNGLVNDFITTIGRDNNNNLWVGTWGGGLHKLMNENLPTEYFVNYRAGSGNNNLISDYISSVVFDNSDNLWIGTLGGLDKLNPKNSIIEHLTAQKTGFDILEIGILKFDHSGNLWIGTRTGLYKIMTPNTLQPNKTLKFTHNNKSTNSLSGDYVLSICEDSNNNLWFGTYGFGLNKLVSEENTGTFTIYSTEQGLPNNIIFTITEDLSGNLWLTTDYGLSRFNVKDKIFRNFFVADGLQNNQYYWSAAFMNNAGKLYFGGMNGLNTFYPDWVVDNTAQSQIVFTDFRILNESVIPGKKYGGKVALTESINTTDEIVLSYKSKEFSFEFSALDFEQPTMNQYAYMLAGFDENWNEVNSNRRFANYTNLKPGTYKFLVKATNSHGEWMEIPKQITIRIIPPYYATWGFRLVLIALIIALIISYNRYRIYSLKMQKRKLETQVHERILEIEKQKEKLEDKNLQLAHRQELIEGQKEKLEIQNELILGQRNKLIDLNKRVKLVNHLKLRFFTNISHEFRTPLTLILGPLEKLISQLNNYDPATQKSILLMNRNAQRLLQLINQLMDFRKLEQGKMKINVSNVNITAFLSNITASFSELAAQKNITLQFIPNEIKEETWFDFQKIENVLYNLLSNAFNHTLSEGKIWIKLYLSKNEENIPLKNLPPEHMIIEIGDTGLGIDEVNLPHIFDRFYQIESDVLTKRPYGTGIGLSLTKELIENHNGEITVTSIKGEGTIFYIHLPFKRSDYSIESISTIEYDPSLVRKQANFLVSEISDKANLSENTVHKLKNKKSQPTILITEDNYDLREFIAVKLNEHFNILEAENGRIGYEIANLNNPDIIISDIMMAEMDGLEFCSRIKTNLVTSHIPVILLTAKGSIENQIEGLETGADIYLPKPFNFELLNAHISNLINSRKKLYEAFKVKTKIDISNMPNTSLDEKFMNTLLKIIDNNIDNSELNVNLLVKELSISRNLLHRKITALANMSIVEFITNIRLKKSVEMLKGTDLNISEVAYAVGFNDPKYFSRIFRKQFGKAPSEFQKGVLDLS